MQTLEHSYGTLKQVVDTKADIYDTADLQEARTRYNIAYQLKDTYPELSAQLAEEAQVLGDLILAKAHADTAARERAKAQDEMAVIERLTIPDGGGTAIPRRTQEAR